MPLELAVWRVDAESAPAPITLAGMDSEDRLQEIIASDISILGLDLMVVGREVLTPFGKRIDILAIDASANLVVIELKRNRTPRDVVAQILDYGSWVRNITSEIVAETFINYQKKYAPDTTAENIDKAFKEKFGAIPEEYNSSHRLIIVASDLDESTERIVGYLREELGADLDVVFFRAFEDGEHQYLTRAWLAEPVSPSESDDIRSRSAKEWNGEFYASFEEGGARRWSDAKKYGFISAGGGNWYVRTLDLLKPGDRVWVLVPRTGYVGVGEVLTPSTRFNEFNVDVDGVSTPVTELEFEAPGAFDEAQGEHFVGIEWTHTVELHDAVKERGFFGNQNTVARPTASAWAFTVGRLKALWSVE